tara:strand:+ start:111 stop:539 length:429 start_codon:yes stop_codon:yes gene_type:complete
MSTVKVDTIQTTGGVSEIAIDKLKGVSSASSISVVAEGGTTTTNMQQGLTKVWARVDQVGTQGIDDSFNLTSITDTAVGFTTFTFANDMNNAVYAVTSCAEYNSLQSISAQATGSAGIAIMNASSAYEDRDMLSIKVSGDLA